MALGDNDKINKDSESGITTAACMSIYSYSDLNCELYTHMYSGTQVDLCTLDSEYIES